MSSYSKVESIVTKLSGLIASLRIKNVNQVCYSASYLSLIRRCKQQVVITN